MPLGLDLRGDAEWREVMTRMIKGFLIGGVMALGFAAPAPAESLCRETVFEQTPHVVCSFDGRADDLRLFLNDEAGAPWRHFDRLAEALDDAGELLLFAMNAGMYHKDRSPVGHYVEDYKAYQQLNRNPGPGNFHMLPNGVFWVSVNDGVKAAHVSTTDDFAENEARDAVRFATQSGPMLVIDGALHPRFKAASTSRKRRNGVGVDAEGRVHFVISDGLVTFHEFARLFRDELGAENALFLDGTISRLFAPELGRDDRGAAMGPIVGVVVGAGAPDQD